MNSRQFCSVCKQWLDMEVVQTADGEDDGVVWFRCPQCQGFLPKLSSAVAGSAGGQETAGVEAVDRTARADGDEASPAPAGGGQRRRAAAERRRPQAEPGEGADEDDGLDDDDDVDVIVGGAPIAGGVHGEADEADDDEVGDDADDDGSPAPAGAATAEPVHEYAAMLAAMDPAAAVPYRPWESYEVGQCILHLAWNDCGVVVAKEALPGGRRVVKCWFQGAGVVRLIENAPR